MPRRFSLMPTRLGRHAALLAFATLALGTGTLCADDAQGVRLFPSPAPEQAQTGDIWDIKALMQVPASHPATETGLEGSSGIFPIFYEGVPLAGKPTQVFAWVGIPEVKPGEQVPGIVLVHGGGGTAFHDWVKLWVDRGYAAIAMDTYGNVPEAASGMTVKGVRHAAGGAPFAGGGFRQSGLPVEDQWMYHAVAAVVRGHSLLRSHPAVDANRVGMTGISWGGILSEVASSIDPRFQFVAPVYGCGFLGENSFWLTSEFQKSDPQAIQRWIDLWDPSQHLFRTRTPMLFVNGTNDKHFRPDSWQKTYRLPQGPVTISLKPRMGHGHPPSGDPKEITVFADSIAKGAAALPSIRAQGQDGDEAWVQFASPVPLRTLELLYTTDSGDWTQRSWKQQPARRNGDRVTAAVPAAATAWYFNLTDDRGCTVSSAHSTRNITIH